MGKQKPFSLRDFLAIEDALTSLDEALTARDEMELETLIARLTEEPKQILALGGHELVEWSRDAVMAIFIALTKKRDYRPRRKLELAAAGLLLWLEALQRHAPAGWGKEPPGWPFKWEEEIRLALFAFVTSRDSLKAARKERDSGALKRPSGISKSENMQLASAHRVMIVILPQFSPKSTTSPLRISAGF